jgi:hypothetical protein
LQGNFSIAVALNAKDRRNGVARAESSGGMMAVRQFFRPCVLACLALAVTVGGWGYGAKLSQYLHHRDVTKPYATRMWVEHRDDSFAAPVHHQHQPHKLLASQFFAVSILLIPRFSREAVFAVPVPSCFLTLVSPLHPLRAPPISLSSLA